MRIEDVRVVPSKYVIRVYNCYLN